MRWRPWRTSPGAMTGVPGFSGARFSAASIRPQRRSAAVDAAREELEPPRRRAGHRQSKRAVVVNYFTATCFSCHWCGMMRVFFESLILDHDDGLAVLNPHSLRQSPGSERDASCGTDPRRSWCVRAVERPGGERSPLCLQKTLDGSALSLHTCKAGQIGGKTEHQLCPVVL